MLYKRSLLSKEMTQEAYMLQLLQHCSRTRGGYARWSIAPIDLIPSAGTIRNSIQLLLTNRPQFFELIYLHIQQSNVQNTDVGEASCTAAGGSEYIHKTRDSPRSEYEKQYLLSTWYEQLNTIIITRTA